MMDSGFKFNNINQFMNNNHNKKSEKLNSYKIQNLSELSISEIWENKYAEESSDFQQERYLINTIDEREKKPRNQYGLQFQRKNSRKIKNKYHNPYELRPSNKLEDSRQVSQIYNSLDKNNALAFNKRIKRKRSTSKQKIPLQTRSAKILFSTRPVPHIQQHTFKSIKQNNKQSLKDITFLKPKKQINLQQQLNNNKFKLKTTLYEIPMRHSGFKDDSTIQKKLYYQMKDQIKVELNDFNCQLMSQPMETFKENQNYYMKEWYETDQTVKNYWQCHRSHNNIVDKSVRSSQMTYLNDTNSQNSWIISNATDRKVFEVKRPHSFDHRNSSAFSSCKTDRHAQSSPFSRDSSRTTKRIDKLKQNCQHNEQVEKFYRNNVKAAQKHCVEYFMNGCIQDTLKGTPFSL